MIIASMLKDKDSFVWRRNVYYRRDAATQRKEKLLLEFKTVILSLSKGAMEKVLNNFENLKS